MICDCPAEDPGSEPDPPLFFPEDCGGFMPPVLRMKFIPELFKESCMLLIAAELPEWPVPSYEFLAGKLR